MTLDFCPTASGWKKMNLTTLGERRIRRDLIETFKVVTGKVKYGQDNFKLSRSGHNIISKINNSVAREICKITLKMFWILRLILKNLSLNQ